MTSHSSEHQATIPCLLCKIIFRMADQNLTQPNTKFWTVVNNLFQTENYNIFSLFSKILSKMFSKIPFSRLIQLYELSWPPRSTSKGYLFNLSTKIPRPFSRVITVNYMPVISMSSWSYFNVHYFALVGITFHLPLCWPLAELYAMQSSSVIIFLNKCIIWKFITFCLFFPQYKTLWPAGGK